MRKLGHELFSRAVMTATEKTKMDSFTLSHSLNAMMCGLAAQKQGFGARTFDATRLHARRRDGAQSSRTVLHYRYPCRCVQHDALLR